MKKIFARLFALLSILSLLFIFGNAGRLKNSQDWRNQSGVETRPPEGYENKSKVEVHLLSEQQTPFETTVIRYKKKYNGHFIFGEEYIKHLDKSAQTIFEVGKESNYNFFVPGEILSLDELRQELKNKFSKDYFQEPDIKEIQWVRNNDGQYELSYEVVYHAEERLSGKRFFVSADKAEIILELPLEHHIGIPALGTGETHYHGIRDIPSTEDSNTGIFTQKLLLENDTIFILNAQNQHNPLHPMLPTSDNNIWIDRGVASVSWGIFQAYSFFKDKFFHEGFNGTGGQGVTVLVHARDQEWCNAVYDYDTERIKVGDGIGYTGICNNGPLNSIDIMGHEFTHGIIHKTSRILNRGQPGAVNESYGDIMGMTLKYNVTPESFEWILGNDQMSTSPKIRRNFANPHLSNQPKCFVADPFWSHDPKNVHTNTGVQNHWFYLLANGGQDDGQCSGLQGGISGVGINNAARLAFYTMKYLSYPFTKFPSTKQASLHLSKTLWGVCSNYHFSNIKAWRAVGFDVNSFILERTNCSEEPRKKLRSQKRSVK